MQGGPTRVSRLPMTVCLCGAVHGAVGLRRLHHARRRLSLAMLCPRGRRLGGRVRLGRSEGIPSWVLWVGRRRSRGSRLGSCRCSCGCLTLDVGQRQGRHDRLGRLLGGPSLARLGGAVWRRHGAVQALQCCACRGQKSVAGRGSRSGIRIAEVGGCGVVVLCGCAGGAGSRAFDANAPASP